MGTRVILKEDYNTIEWRDGIPFPKSAPKLSVDGLRGLFSAALALPYAGNPNDPDEDPSYYGRSKAEVMMIKLADRAAQGDLETARFLLEHVVGKAKQSVESLNVNLKYTDYLDTFGDPTPLKNVTPLSKDDF